MRPLHSVTALREALQCLMRSDLPSRHKAVLIEAVMHMLSDREAAQRADQSTSQSRPWQEDEIERLRTLLAGHAARSWQEADELATRCAREFRCAPGAVREQAAMLGLSAAVDYRPGRSKVSER
jgi:hypothetical protein